MIQNPRWSMYTLHRRILAIYAMWNGRSRPEISISISISTRPQIKVQNSKSWRHSSLHTLDYIYFNVPFCSCFPNPNILIFPFIPTCLSLPFSHPFPFPPFLSEFLVPFDSIPSKFQWEGVDCWISRGILHSMGLITATQLIFSSIFSSSGQSSSLRSCSSITLLPSILFPNAHVGSILASFWILGSCLLCFMLFCMYFLTRELDLWPLLCVFSAGLELVFSLLNLDGLLLGR